MSDPTSLRMISGVSDGTAYIYSTYYVSGMIILLFSIWLLFQRKSPIKLCHWNPDQSINRYLNAATFYLLRGLSYITAGIIAQFCATETTTYYIIWSLSIILNDCSLLYLITLIGPICILKGWPFCPLYSQLRFGGKVPVIWIIMIVIAIICVLLVTIYDLIIFTKYAGIILESLILIYFFIYLIIDGCFSFMDNTYLQTIWLYINYILFTWTGFILLSLYDMNDEVYIDMNFNVLYNVINMIAMIILFTGILYENKIRTEIRKTEISIIENIEGP